MLYDRVLECGECGNIWEVSFGLKMIHVCPKCGSKDVFMPMYDGAVDHDIMDPHLFS